MGKQLKVSPAGTAQYPYLRSPNTKWKEEGEYKINLIVPTTEAQEFKTLVDQAVEASVEEARKENPKVAEKIVLAYPYEEDEEEGAFVFRFKTPAVVTRKKDGKQFSMKPDVVDSKRNPLPEDMNPGGGSRVKVAFDFRPYYIPGTKTAGVSLDLKAVQVLTYVEFSGGAADAFAEEEGYAAEAPGSDDPFDDESTESAF